MTRAGYAEARITTWAHTADPPGYPPYVNERSDLGSRIRHMQRRAGEALTRLFDPKRGHGNTPGGFFHTAAHR